MNNVGSNKDVIEVKQTGKGCITTKVIERDDLLPTMMDEGSMGRGGRIEVKLSALKVVWLEAQESMTQSVTVGGTITMVWKEGASGCWSQDLNHGVHAVGGGGARGDVKIGLTYYGGRP
jgi:hypothetical protein